jgi:hypothetical protein
MDESRRDFVRVAVASAILSAAPLSVIKAATSGQPVVFNLQDGTQLRITGQNGKYTAVHLNGARIVDAKPSGSFTLMSGEVLEMRDGTVTRGDVKPPLTLRGGDDTSFVLFVKS